MFSVKQSMIIALFPLFVFANLVADSTNLMIPNYPSFPVITLSSTGSAPVYSGKPVCTQRVGLNLLNKVGTAVSIDSVFFISDTLHIVPGNRSIIYLEKKQATISPDLFAPIYYAYTVVFDACGTYTMVLQDTVIKTQFTKIGSVLIYPYFSTMPSMPVVTTATRLTLTLGQSHSVCNPTYTNVKFMVKADTIALTYTETPYQGPCAAIYLISPVPYGPVFDLGMLDTGTYVLKIDALTLGLMRVDPSFPLTGSVTVMKSPYTKSMPVPIANVFITGIVAQSCPPFLNYDTATTTTNAAGAFSLLMQPANHQYTIFGEKKGYYPQILTADVPGTATPLSFQLIPNGMDTVGTLNVTVKKNAAPVESVSVSIVPGRLPTPCPQIMYKRAVQVSAYRFTDKAGAVSFKDMTLIPVIDYMYQVYYYKNGFNFYRSGTVRLNPFVATNLDFDIGNTAISSFFGKQSSPLTRKLYGRILSLSCLEQKFGKNAFVSLFDTRGRAVLRVAAESSSRIDLSSLSAGRYLIRISSPALMTTESLLVP